MRKFDRRGEHTPLTPTPEGIALAVETANARRKVFGLAPITGTWLRTFCDGEALCELATELLAEREAHAATKARLEATPGLPDGIACRDATIAGQGKRIERLEAQRAASDADWAEVDRLAQRRVAAKRGLTTPAEEAIATIAARNARQAQLRQEPSPVKDGLAVEQAAPLTDWQARAEKAEADLRRVACHLGEVGADTHRLSNPSRAAIGAARAIVAPYWLPEVDPLVNPVTGLIAAVAQQMLDDPLTVTWHDALRGELAKRGLVVAQGEG